MFFYPSVNYDKGNNNLDSLTLDPDKLHTSEVYLLDLKSKLVVLSACETGIGKINSSEGSLALARSFILAGSENVLITLWKISDRHTKDFMLLFYNFIHKGHSISKSLQLTKLHYLSRDKLNSPFFWSGYILIGQ